MRLYILVEGPTELEFVKRVLAPHLNSLELWTEAIVVATKRDKKTGAKLGKGGGFWKQWRKDFQILSRQQPGSDVRLSSLFDLYGLPEDFPELEKHQRVLDTKKRVALLEAAMTNEVDDRRFIAYLQRHEMEALVLAALDQLPNFLEKEEDRSGVAALRESLGNLEPEDVNDDEKTAPSKRLKAFIPGYSKTKHGPQAIEAEGLESLRRQCPRFDAWVKKLEDLVR